MEVKTKAGQVALEYLMLTLATMVLVIGVYVFKFPNNFSFGGVTGISVILGAVLHTHLRGLHLSSIWYCLLWDLFFWEKALE